MSWRPQTDSDAYAPIDCGLHDELQLLAMRRREVDLRVRAEAEGDPARELRDRIVDVYTRGGAEWIRLGSGEEIRLDRLVEVDGRAFQPPS